MDFPSAENSLALAQELKQLQVHSHPALIYNSLEDEVAVIAPFVGIGLERGEKCVFMADDHSVEDVTRMMRDSGIGVEAAIASGQLSIISSSDVPLPREKLDAEELINLLAEVMAAAKAEGYPALRAISEMTWTLDVGGGGMSTGLMEIEAGLNQFMSRNDALGICGYSRVRFEARTILDVMRTHPQIIYRGQICRNPYFVPPAELLQATPGQRSQMEMERQLAVMVGRKLADEALEESERAYHILAENLPGIVYRIYVRDNNRVRFFNLLAREVTGYSAAELSKCRDCPLDQVILEEDRERTAAMVRCAVVEKRPFSIEYRIRHRDGRIRHLLEQGSPLYGPDDEPLYIDGVIFDITDRVNAETAKKQADENLKKSEEKYRTLFEESKDVIFISSPEGRVLDMNPAGIELFGYDSLAEIRDLEIPYDLHMDHREWHNIEQIVQQQGFVKNYELIVLSKDERSLDISLTVSAIESEDGGFTGYRGIIRDITASRKMEQELIQAQKMESIGRLAGGVAHDFNNYLTAIQGYIELAIMALPADSPAREDLVEAKGSSERAADLSRQLLLFGRREHLQLQPVQLNAIIGSLMNMLRRLIGERFEIRTHLDPELDTINADARHIDQVIMNLVVNARDAMPEGGVISITTGNAEIDSDIAAADEGRPPGRYVRLTVQDHGVGMDALTVSRIFEPFFSSKPTGKGTGLGLSVVYGIVTQHYGWIDVDSDPGGGTIFNIYFPAVEGAAVAAAAAPLLESRSRGRGQQILLVEDESTIRDLVTKMLTENGYVVYPAEDAEAALIIFEEKPAIDLIFSDVVLPGQNGVWLVDRIRKKNPLLKILLASGYSDEEYRREIDEKGYGFMHKPYSLPDLLHKVNELVDGHE